MVFAAWMRQIWTDPRLSFDFQCYGGMDYIEIQAQAGSENNRIWVPDIEMYNMEEPMLSLGWRLAMVYSCWDGKPSRGGCGYVFWSRPGLLKALCRYSGLVDFPLDRLGCKLEIAGWAIDGRYQDIVVRNSDGGYNYQNKPLGPGELTSIAGLTAGSSYQDYRIDHVSASRQVVFYDCCPQSPYPTLIYNLRFERSRNFYMEMLVIPQVVLVVLSFAEFVMDPETGERLGYGVTIILAM